MSDLSRDQFAPLCPLQTLGGTSDSTSRQEAATSLLLEIRNVGIPFFPFDKSLSGVYGLFYGLYR